MNSTRKVLNVAQKRETKHYAKCEKCTTKLLLCKVILLAPIFIILFVATNGCDKLRNFKVTDELLDAIKEPPCNCIMDTLKGEWEWIRRIIAGDNPPIVLDNSFTAILKILNKNTGSSVNYEIWVEDTLFSQGSFQFKEPGMWIFPHFIHCPYYDHNVIAAINIKHFRTPFSSATTEEWNMNMLFTNYIPQAGSPVVKGDTTDYPLLVLFDRGLYYCYQKIK